jgi:hypothetical protein
MSVHMGTLNDCYRHAKTWREYLTAGLGPIVANRFKSGLLDIPPYRSIPLMNQEVTCADGVGTTTKMMPSDDGGHILATYGEFVEVFSKDNPETPPPHLSTGHAIDLQHGYSMPCGWIYNVSEFELMTLKAYIEVNLANGFIQHSSSPAAAPILFAKKKDGGFRLSVDNNALNLATVKNRYPLPWISEMLDGVLEARVFTKLDLHGDINNIRIKGGDEYNTAFGMSYWQFEYWVMPFGLTNAPATFQWYIDDCLWPFIDDFVVYYLSNILIYSTNEKEHEEHVHHVLQRLKQFGLYCQTEKCRFRVAEVGLLGHVITADAVGMDSDRISTIDDWPTPKSVGGVQVLLGFTNFYRRFIPKYANVTLPLTELLNKSETYRGKNLGDSPKWQWTREAKLAFPKLKRTFTKALILQHFDTAKTVILTMDLSGFAIARFLNQ